MADQFDYDAFTPRVAVVGVGGQGSNLVNRLFGYGIKSADTIAMNTDIGHLNMIKAQKKILIGKNITNGLGAGGFPEVAAKCADVSRAEIEAACKATIWYSLQQEWEEEQEQAQLQQLQR